MWNHGRHLEAYFGTAAAGAVLHTLNLRLHPDELAYIVNDAEDRFLIVDDTLLPIFEQIKDKTYFERVIVVPFGRKPAEHSFEDYEGFLRIGDSTLEYPDMSEQEPAAMCYTSGTTGKPKGVVYSHRALALHSYSISLPDNFSISRHDTILPAMSRFHANAWGFPFAAVMNGSKLVFPGPNLQPDAILDLLTAERVTLTGAVPTVWLGVLAALEKTAALAAGKRASHYRRRFSLSGSLISRIRQVWRAGDPTLGHDRNNSYSHSVYVETSHGISVGG